MKQLVLNVKQLGTTLPPYDSLLYTKFKLFKDHCFSISFTLNVLLSKQIYRYIIDFQMFYLIETI